MAAPSPAKRTPARRGPTAPKATSGIDITFDPDKMTLGEMEEFEEILGKSFEEATASGKVSAKAVTVMVWLSVRKTKPDFTLDDARALTTGELNFVRADGKSGTVEA